METESSRDLKSWAKSRASQNRSDQSFLQCTAHNTISTFDLFQSLHNVKMVLDACIELLQDASTLMQEGKLCRYVYTERILQTCIQSGRTYTEQIYRAAAQRLKLQLDRSMLHLFRCPCPHPMLLKCQIYSHLLVIFHTFSSEPDYADKPISYWFTFLGTQNVSSSSSSCCWFK